MRSNNFKGTRRILATTAATAGLLAVFTGVAHAGGGDYTAKTSDSCGKASGTYHYTATGTADGQTKYKTDWTFTVTDNCKTDGKSVSLYT